MLVLPGRVISGCSTVSAPCSAADTMQRKPVRWRLLVTAMEKASPGQEIGTSAPVVLSIDSPCSRRTETRMTWEVPVPTGAQY